MIIDLHCDTFTKLYNVSKREQDNAAKKLQTIRDNDFHIDLDKLNKGNVLIQCFAVFNHFKNGYDTDRMYNIIDYILAEVQKNKNLIDIYTGIDSIQKSIDEDKICGMLTIEDLGPIMGDINHIKKLHDLNFKILSLTWNHENTLAYPNSKDKNIMNKPLKPFGIEVIELMNELNMIVDVSHLNDGGFYDVLKYNKKPFVATHSNARAMTNQSRNLSDSMIKSLSEKGGIMGINYFHLFLCDEGKISRISDMIRHIKHIRNIGGIECIALGSDFDGIGSQLEMIDASGVPMLIDALSLDGFTSDEIDKITHKNATRVLEAF